MLTTTCVLNLEKILETNRILWTLEHWDELEIEQRSEIERLHFIYEVANHNHDHDDTDGEHTHESESNSDAVVQLETDSDENAIQQVIENSNDENVANLHDDGNIMKLDEEENKSGEIQLGFNKQNAAGDGGLRAELQRMFGYLSNQEVNTRCKKFSFVGTEKKYSAFKNVGPARHSGSVYWAILKISVFSPKIILKISKKMTQFRTRT